MGPVGNSNNRGHLITQSPGTEGSNSKEVNSAKQQTIEANNTAANVIQKHVRNYLLRKGILSNACIPEYKLLCNRQAVNGMDEAKGGKTHVYLPASHSAIVLKASGNDCKDRLNKMREVRQTINELECSHLIIPKAISFNGFLIEDRLPINTNSFHNMHHYTSSPNLFDNAVKEMVRLSSKYYLSDLVNSQRIPLGHIADVNDFVRYDNIPLYLVTENGQTRGVIGLIDLEHITTAVNGEALPSLVRIFPLHSQLIKTEAARLGMTFDDDELQAAELKGNKYLQVGYLNHLNHLKKKEVSNNSHDWSIDISSERFNDLNNKLEEELLKMHSGECDALNSEEFLVDTPKDFLVGNIKSSAKALSEKISPIIIANIRQAAKDYINKEGSNKDLTNLEYDQMISLRSLHIKRNLLHKGVMEAIHESPSLIDGLKIDEMDTEVAEQLAHVVINELIRGGEILDYDPADYMGYNSICWLRY